MSDAKKTTKKATKPGQANLTKQALKLLARLAFHSRDVTSIERLELSNLIAKLKD